MASQPPRAQKFQQSRPVVDKEGRPTTEFLRQLNSGVTLLNFLAEIQAATDAAQAAADAANTAAGNAQAVADATSAETSLVNSYVANFAGSSVISADSAGNVTIGNHDRIYGDSTLNPTVAVTGDTLATGETNPTVVRVFYDDPARVGGAVTYQYTTDATDAAQTGDRHSVGAVEIPAAGSSDGGYVRPPGYAGQIP